MKNIIKLLILSSTIFGITVTNTNLYSMEYLSEKDYQGKVNEKCESVCKTLYKLWHTINRYEEQIKRELAFQKIVISGNVVAQTHI